jgi:hypothetical protein
MPEERNLPVASEKPLSPIERSVRFMVDNLFRGDLAVWDKELKEYFSKLGIERQPKN